MEPPVALVSAQSTTPFYRRHFWLRQIICRKKDAYIENSTANRGTRGHGRSVSAEALASVGRERLVSNAVVVVEAAGLGQRIHVVKFH